MAGIGTIGVIGGGQLARMMVGPAVQLGIELRVLSEAPDASAAIATTAIGDHRDPAAVLAFARGVDAVTFDHEHVPQAVLELLLAEGIPVRPGPSALRFAQDKLAMRSRLTELGLPVPDWAAVADAREVEAFLREHGDVAVLKTPTGGYDGKGVRIVRSAADAADWLARGGPLLIEELVPFRRELAQSVARRPSGQTAFWPLVESIQREGVCAEVIAPAPASSGRESAVAAEIAVAVAEGLDVTGVLAVELFETDDERILVNELAMRPHNSGHWSIEGSTTSQFEQHLRAVLDLPLGDTAVLAPWTVMVNVLGGPADGDLARPRARALGEHPDVAVHLYGKTPRPGRKIGHVTALGAELDDVAYRARAAAAAFD